MPELLEDYEKLTEDELDEKIQDVMKKLDIAYSLGHDGIVDQLVFHLDNLKMALGDKLEKQRFEVLQGKLPNQFSLTDDDLDEESKE